jgi:hypothetical protein
MDETQVRWLRQGLWRVWTGPNPENDHAGRQQDLPPSAGPTRGTRTCPTQLTTYSLRRSMETQSKRRSKTTYTFAGHSRRPGRPVLQASTTIRCQQPDDGTCGHTFLGENKLMNRVSYYTAHQPVHPRHTYSHPEIYLCTRCGETVTRPIHKAFSGGEVIMTVRVPAVRVVTRRWVCEQIVRCKGALGKKKMLAMRA